MTATAARRDARPLDLPPGFSVVGAREEADAFALACGVADREGAGTLVWSASNDCLDLAVVLEPDEPLRTARRAFVAGMVALADAVSSEAPPEKPVALGWPDEVRFDGARLGGGRLGWPSGCADDEAPAWLVFSGTLIASKARAGDPGLTPGSTSLEEEGVRRDAHPAVVEAFARYLMKSFHAWREDGFDALAARYLARLASTGPGGPRTGQGSGGVAPDLSFSPEPLAALLRVPSWLDRATGAPRL